MLLTGPRLHPLLAIAAAIIDEAGTLIEANRGFLRIIEVEESQARGMFVAQFFIQPDFATLLKAPVGADGEIHRGLLTVGDYMRKTRTLRGSVRRDGPHLHFLAEHDIEELERIQDNVLKLNNEYALAQLQLAQVNQRIQQLNAQLEQRVAERTRELSDALQLAEAANRAKSLFLGNMSHELRTPMNAVMGMTDLALHQATDARQIEHLKKGKEAAHSLLAIINDILDMSRLAAGKLDIGSVDFSLPSVVDAVAAPLVERARKKGLTLEIRIDPALPRGLHGDPERIQQVLGHLLHNAIKFSERGLITLSALRDKAQGNEVLMRIEVSDQGIGIAEDAQGRIFDLFEQSDNSFTRKHGGTGLGLALCKHLIKLMGGDIGVRSTPGQGSTFWATVPLALGVEPIVITAANTNPVTHDLPATTLPESAAEKPAIDWDSAPHTLRELTDLLTISDFNVPTFCDDHADLVNAVLGEQAGEFRDAIDNFDADAALGLLQAAIDSCPRLQAGLKQ